jgi:DNA-binding SARP family transcriptional activator
VARAEVHPGRAALGEPETGFRSNGKRRGRLVIRLFGPLVVEDGARVLGPRDLGGIRPKQVLEILLAARGRRVPTDRLVEQLWPQELPQNAAGSLQTFISVLRRHLLADRERVRELVVTEVEAYRFASELVDLDLDRFDALVERSASEPTLHARRSLEEALALVRGEVLEDEPYALWAEDLRSAYRGRVLDAYLKAADAALAELDHAAALAHAESAVDLDRFSERSHRTAMLALYALGRQHDALETYRRFRARLDEELGLEPTAEARALESAILRQEDVRLLVPRPASRTHTGGPERMVRLLGRTSELEDLERAARRGLDGSFALLLVEGEVGVGKTRLLDELGASLADIRIGRASGSELEQHLPYVPLASALRAALTDAELDPERRPAIGQVLPELSFGESGREPAEIDALEALADVIAEHAPLVLLLDDIHWADSATVAAISYVQRRCADCAVVVVAAVRSEELPVGHPIRRLRPTMWLRLEPLTADDLAPLGMPELHESTGGNARLVTAVSTNGGGGALSPAVAEAILAQVRAEGAWSYRVLVAASVLEQPFQPEPLAALLRVDAAELAEELERLCERRILRVDGCCFRFRYELVREVLLDSLSPARERLLRERLEPRRLGPRR